MKLHRKEKLTHINGFLPYPKFGPQNEGYLTHKFIYNKLIHYLCGLNQKPYKVGLEGKIHPHNIWTIFMTIRNPNFHVW